MRSIVIWGAGRIGRGFVADIFSQARDFRLVFVDIDAGLVRNLNAAGGYTIARAARDGISKKRLEGNFEAVHTGDEKRLKALFEEEALLLDIAVHEPKLTEVADMLAPLITHRAQSGLPMDVLMNVNAHRPDLKFCALMRERLTGEALSFFDAKVGVSGIFAMCISPLSPGWLVKEDPLALWNNGWETQSISRPALKCAPPEAPRLLLVNDIEREETRKLYTLNMAHAFLSYLGLRKGLNTAFQAVKDEELSNALSQALGESSMGLTARYGFTQEEMALWREKIVALLENPYIEDDLRRLGADSRRKLAPGDRLTGPARLAESAGTSPCSLARAIRAGFEYENDDPGTRAVREYFLQYGLTAALEKFCGLKEGEELFDLVLRA